MWCNKCHAGSDKMIVPEGVKCSMCGSTEYTDDLPFDRKNTRSIRANSKRVNHPEDAKDATALTEEIEDHLKASKHNT